MFMAQLQANWLADIGLGPDTPFRWAIVLLIGIAVGAAFGAFQGYIIAYVGVPSFIVTLGGLLAIRGLVWYLSGGSAVTGIDPTFTLLGGTPEGSIGGPLTWAVGVIGSVAVIALLYNNRRKRRQYGFPLRPMWAEVLLGAVGTAVILGLSFYANSNKWPQGLADRINAQRGLPAGIQIETGFPNPVMIVLGVTLVVTWLATRRRFGRYVYAYGGNPDAAALAGINTRQTILKTYVLMGVLCAIAAAIAVARLTAATLDIGTSYELYVIAAAVVGGTSFAGGIGTIPGAVLGALVMQSLAYGLSYIGVDSPGQNVAAGVVLILAVGLDAWNRRRGTRTTT
jgi:D-xylose transport system permease protein